jgi:hypothetical protein
MKRFFDSCRRHRQNISLLAAGVLSAGEEDRMRKHLAACADCRRYFGEIKTVTGPMANWAESLPQIRPSASAQRRWTQAIKTAGPPYAIRRFSPVASFCDWAHDVFWPARRVWAGLAAVWLLILAGNLSLREPPPASSATSASSSREAIASFRDQQKILAELLPDLSAPRETTQQKPFLPKPRTERFVNVSV